MPVDQPRNQGDFEGINGSKARRICLLVIAFGDLAKKEVVGETPCLVERHMTDLKSCESVRKRGSHIGGRKDCRHMNSLPLASSRARNRNGSFWVPSARRKGEAAAGSDPEGILSWIRQALSIGTRSDGVPIGMFSRKQHALRIRRGSRERTGAVRLCCHYRKAVPGLMEAANRGAKGSRRLQPARPGLG
jgi:hypothetical protein